MLKEVHTYIFFFCSIIGFEVNLYFGTFDDIVEYNLSLSGNYTQQSHKKRKQSIKNPSFFY